MFLMSALFQAIFLSPILVALLIVVGILLVFRGKRRAAGVLLAVICVLLCAFSTNVASNALLKPLEYRAKIFSDSSPGVDAIVVLGGGVLEGAPDQGGRPSLSPPAQKRLIYGLLLYRKLGVPLFVSGGKPWRSANAASEADVAADMLVGLGVPAERIFKEGASDTTWENARLLAPLLAAHGVRRIALVTSAAHMPRARIAFSRAGIDFVPAPTDYLSQSKHRTFVDFLPTFNALRDSFVALQEYCGIVVYALRR
jgi:uncharacterized SAM-binding protein YcdF (DUF218 family)